MSLTESPPKVERLASAWVWSGWSYVIGRVVAVIGCFGSVGPATEGIAIVRKLVLVRPERRVCDVPNRSIDVLARAWMIIAMKRASGAPN